MAFSAELGSGRARLFLGNGLGRHLINLRNCGYPKTGVFWAIPPIWGVGIFNLAGDFLEAYAGSDCARARKRFLNEQSRERRCLAQIGSPKEFLRRSGRSLGETELIFGERLQIGVGYVFGARGLPNEQD